MELYEWDEQFEILDPFENYFVTLDEYLGMMACAIRTPTQGLVEISNERLVALWAQQSGASHEDWGHDEELASIFSISSQMEIGGLPAGTASLRAISNTVLKVGEDFLEYIDQQE